MKTRKMLSKIFCALLVMALIATSAPLMGFATDDGVLTSKPYYIINYDGGVKTCYDNVGDANTVYNIYRKTPDTDYVMIGTAKANKAGVVQYLDSTAVHLETYTYDVAVNGGELGGSPLTIEYISTPNFTATISSEGLKIEIEPLEGIDFYSVNRNDGTDTKLHGIATVYPSDNPCYNDTAINLDDQYHYMIRASHNGYYSYYHTQDAAILSSGVKALANVNGGVKVTYDKVEDAVGYAIFRRTEDSDWVQATTFGAKSYNYTVDYSAVSGTIYYYTVAGITKDGTILYNADYKKIMYLEDPSVFLSIGDDGIVVDFTPANGADYYEILRAPADGSSSLKTIGKVNGDDLCTYTDTTAVEGESYKYAVRPRNTLTGVIYSGYFNSKTIDYALFFEDTDDTVVIAPADTTVDTTVSADTTIDTTVSADTTIDTTVSADTTAEVDTTAVTDDVATADKTVTDILAQVFAFIGQLLTKLGVDASFLDGVLPVIDTIFGFVNNIISIAG